MNKKISGKHWRKLEKLALVFDRRKYKANANHELDAVNLILEEDAIYEKRRLEAKKHLRQTIYAFARALDDLNTVNAQLNCGPVNIEDELFHHCYSQETLNERYADINVRHNAATAERLARATAAPEQNNNQELNR